MKINPAGSTSTKENLDPFDGFSADGHVKNATEILAALPNDPYPGNLRHLFRDNVFGNIILAARRLWFQGYEGCWLEIPELPSSWLLTPFLQKFIEEERRKLAAMMNVDDCFRCKDISTLNDTRVDLQYALGFGEHRCVQADFLMPAILEMAAKIEATETTVNIVPEPGPRNRPILFNSRATDMLLRNLVDFATKFHLDGTIAKQIHQKYIRSLGSVDKNSVDYELGAISFIFDVHISNFRVLFSHFSSILTNFF